MPLPTAQLLVAFLGQLLLIAGLGALAWALGRRVLARAAPAAPAATSERITPAAPIENGLAVATGVGVLAQLLFALAALGLLRPAVLLGVLAMLVGWMAWSAPRFRMAVRGALRGRRWVAAAAALAATAVPLVLLSLYPPTAFDATTYHLPLARAFARAGGFVWVPELRFPVFPLLDETVRAALLPLGERAAHALSPLAVLATAILLLEWARERIGTAAPLAAGIWIGSPLVVYFAGTAYVEPLLTLFATAALRTADRAAREGSPRLFALAGAFAGWGAATKYPALLLPLAVAAWAAAARGVPGQRGRGALAALGGALLTAGPWYLRIVLLTANPVFPFASSLFGTSPWSQIPLTAHSVRPAPLAEIPGRAVRLFWDLAFARERYNSQPPVTPLYLVSLPAFAHALWRLPWTRPLAAIAAAWLAAFFFLPTDPRYLQPVLPVLALVAAAGWHQLAAGRTLLPSFTAWRSAAVIAALPGILYAGFVVWRMGPVPTGPGARTEFLREHRPLTPALAYLDRLHGAGYRVYAPCAESTKYFGQGTVLGEHNGPQPYHRVLARGVSAQELATLLRGWGADHLLLRRDACVPPARYDPDFERWFEPLYTDPAAELFALRSPAGSPSAALAE